MAPPVGVILPGSPYVIYGQTTDEAIGANLMLLLIISDAAPVEMTQRALDAYLGIGPSETSSIPQALVDDPTLGGAVEWCVPVNVTNYGRIDYSGVTYFGARLNLSLGAS